MSETNNNRRSKIPSWKALLLGILGIEMAGIFKVIFKSYPVEAVIGGIVTVTLGYITKRVIQKHKSFNNHEQYHGE